MELDDRKVTILKAIIKTYLETTDEMIERKKRLFADEKRSD